MRIHSRGVGTSVIKLGRVLILKERLSLIDFLWGYATLLNRGGVQP